MIPRYFKIHKVSHVSYPILQFLHVKSVFGMVRPCHIPCYIGASRPITIHLKDNISNFIVSKNPFKPSTYLSPIQSNSRLSSLGSARSRLPYNWWKILALDISSSDNVESPSIKEIVLLTLWQLEAMPWKKLVGTLISLFKPFNFGTLMPFNLFLHSLCLYVWWRTVLWDLRSSVVSPPSPLPCLYPEPLWGSVSIDHW